MCVNNSFDTVFYHLQKVCVCLFVCLCVRVCMFVCLREREIVLLRDQTMCTCNNNITQRKHTHSHMCSSLTATYIRFLQFTRQITVYRSDRSLLWPLKVACSLPSGSPTQCICRMQSSENECIVEHFPKNCRLLHRKFEKRQEYWLGVFKVCRRHSDNRSLLMSRNVN